MDGKTVCLDSLRTDDLNTHNKIQGKDLKAEKGSVLGIVINIDCKQINIYYKKLLYP